MSFQLDNRVWAQEFTEHASFDDEDSNEDSNEDFEVVELPLSFPTNRQDFLRARRRYHTPEERDEEEEDQLLAEIPETPTRQVILRDLSLSPPPLTRAATNPISTYRERVVVHALRDVGFTLETIARRVNKPQTTVGHIVRNPTTPPRRRIGRYFDTPRRRQLIDWLELDPRHRRFTLAEVIRTLGLPVSESTLRRAFAQEGIYRFKAKSAPWIPARTSILRVNYADLGLRLPAFHWLHCAWIDEGFFNLEGAQDLWISRRVGEGYNPEFMVPKFKAVNFSIMVWICFTARAKCQLVFWEDTWGKINSASYCEHVVPILVDFISREEEITAQPHHVVQDGAPAHKARNTRATMEAHGLRLMPHPPSSPDLNLAENPIGRMKYNIQNRRERRPTNKTELRQAIQWEWEQYDQGKLARLCERFPRRLRAVKDVGGGPTRY
jgi:transposase